MDENYQQTSRQRLSWRARLAKSNINILKVDLLNKANIDVGGITYRWYVEFTYHPKPGTFKWCKTYIDIPPVFDTYAATATDTANKSLAQVDNSTDDMAQTILDRVLELRKELEG